MLKYHLRQISWAARRLRSRWRTFREHEVVSIHRTKVSVRDLSPSMRERLFMGVYERSEHRIIQKFVQRNDRAIEVGAGIGYISTILAKRCGSANVIVFEPNPSLHPKIRETFVLNNVNPRLFGAAVTRMGLPVTLHTCEDFWSSSTYERPSAIGTVECNSYAFSAVVHEHQPTFLIIDIEGGELDFVGLPIDQCVQKIAIELHESVIGRKGCDSVRQWVENQGFHIIVNGSNRSVVYWERCQTLASGAPV